MGPIAIEPRVSVHGVIRDDDDALYRDAVLQTRYYNYYYSYGRHFRPRKVFEIGVRCGYTGYFLLAGASGSVVKYRGVDLQTYLTDSNRYATELLSGLCQDVRVSFGDSHALNSLDDKYDLIHIDGDHSYEGKLKDLALAFSSLSKNGVIVVDDYGPHGAKEPIFRAVKTFLSANPQLKMQQFQPLCGSPMNPVSGHALLSLR